MVDTAESQLTLNCKSINELSEIATEIIRFSGSKGVIAFEGELGAGKTTLIKEICGVLGVTGTVASPSFSIINEYRNTEGDPVYHVDFYRIKDVEEAFGTGAEEYFYSGDLCFIEWPSMASELIPNNHILVEIEVTGPGSRIFHIKKYD